eukprot:CAMPEP_0113600794 /NCGR_PEP_ID=MMETSP0015_2-20120614/42891_1 /TAXON_ID=2838 /ORGANISM="Odontella" /LENGTH=300 /DNA_ID=CAMNT_0000509063 /DNA_START=291 /DNA_END=1194 /DNA_ORIENTATION=- /assembly_acc=CAM_ASM_000160
MSAATTGPGEQREVAGCHVVITKPPKSPSGITFLLTASNMPLEKYDSIRDALLSIGNVVVGFYINSLRPLRRNHRVKAEFPDTEKRVPYDEYSIVGHSVGGKIALMVAALHDADQVLNSVIALDPIDQSPVEFTNKELGNNISLKGSKANITVTVTESGPVSLGNNISLKGSKANITVTVTESGPVSMEHNGRAIHKFNQNVELILHRHAGHMAYCDEGGKLSWKAAMGTGNPEKSAKAKREAIELVKGRAKSKVGGKQLRGVKKLVSETKAAAKDFSDDVKDSGKKVSSGLMMKGMLGL